MQPGQLGLLVHQIIHGDIGFRVAGHHCHSTFQLKSRPHFHLAGIGQFHEDGGTCLIGLRVGGGDIQLCFLRGCHVHFCPAVTDTADELHNVGQLLLGLGETVLLLILRPLGDHNGLALVRQALPDFLGDIGHEGVQQLQGAAHDPYQHLTGGLCLGFVAGLHADFGNLDIPVAEAIPQEVVELLDGNAQLEFLQIVGNFLGHVVQSADNPLVFQLQGFGQSVGHIVAVNVHEDKAGSVPNLVGKVPAGGHLFVGEAQVVSGAVAGHQSKAQGVRAVLLNDLQGVDSVAQRLTHLAALCIPHQAMEEHGLKGRFLHVLNAGENHSGNPEEDDIITGHQCAGGIEVFQLFGVIRPAQRGERPQSGAEPSVQGVGVLL